MAAVDSINADDRILMRRVTVALALLLIAAAGYSRLHVMYSQKFYEVTGEARWIWARHRMSDNTPLAFFATRDIEFPERRRYAHLKVLGDPEYTVYLNGKQIAGRMVGEEREIDFYDISSLVHTGKNRLLIAVRAKQGVGGLIASIDIGPEAENWVVTDEDWRIYRAWRDELPVRDPVSLVWERPVIVGEPPIGKWNYLKVAKRSFAAPSPVVLPPRQSFPLRALLPAISTRGGIAVAIAEPMRATAYDFGFTRGRLRLTLLREQVVSSRAVKLRSAYGRDELGAVEWDVRTVVFAPGERVLTTPEVHDLRYVLVYGNQASVAVVR